MSYITRLVETDIQYIKKQCYIVPDYEIWSSYDFLSIIL